MSTNQVELKVERILALDEQIAELKRMSDELKDSIKEEMTARNTDMLKTPKYVIRWVDVVSQRLDTKQIKALLGKEIYASLCKNIFSKKFTISA